MQEPTAVQARLIALGLSIEVAAERAGLSEARVEALLSGEQAWTRDDVVRFLPVLGWTSAEFSAASGGGRAAFHQAAAAYRKDDAERRLDSFALPAGGYVVFYHGQPAGWTESVARKPEGWLADCVAVPPEADGTLYVARGGNYQDGAERWEALAQ